MAVTQNVKSIMPRRQLSIENIIQPIGKLRDIIEIGGARLPTMKAENLKVQGEKIMEIKLKPCKCGNTDLKVEAHKTYSRSWIVYAYCPDKDCAVNPGVGLSRFKKVAHFRAVRDWNRGNK